MATSPPRTSTVKHTSSLPFSHSSYRPSTSSGNTSDGTRPVDRPVHDRHVRVVVPVAVVMDVARPTAPSRPDLHLLPDHPGGHGHHECADLSPDVEQDGALPGEGVLDWPGASHDAFVVPGTVW